MCRKWETPYLGSSPIRWVTQPLAVLQCATSRIRKSRPRVPSNSRLRSQPRSIKDSVAGVPFVARSCAGRSSLQSRERNLDVKNYLKVDPSQPDAGAAL